MNAITKALLCSLALSFVVADTVPAQNTAAGIAALPRRAQLTVERSALQGTLPVRFRCEWGGAVVTLAKGRVMPVYLSGFLGTSMGGDYAMYSQPFTVEENGGVLGFHTSAGVEIGRDALDERLPLVGDDIVVGQMIDLIDADSGELLRGIRGTFLRFTGTSPSPDSSWSYNLRVDLGAFAGRRVQLRSIVAVAPGSEPCQSCSGGPLPRYLTWHSDLPAPVPTVAVESRPRGTGRPSPIEPATAGEGVRPILR